MSQLRRAITRYVFWLESRAARHHSFAVILTAVAHRLRHILDNTDDPDTETQYAVKEDGVYRILDHLEGLPSGTQLYTRTATYTAWKEI
jgi:hypothetical protein